MYRIDWDIRIGDVQLRGLQGLVIESSTDLLSDTCQITVPATSLNKAFDLEGRVKRGDRVTVKLGYDGKLQEEFTGYLLRISPNSPLKLDCEDSAYQFRRPIGDKVFKKTNVVAIIRYVLDEVNKQLDAADRLALRCDLSGMQFDSFSIHRANGYEVLQKLKEDTGLAIYCRGRELHVHLTFAEKRGECHYDFGRNVEDSDDLQYVRAQDTRVRVKVVGRSKKGAEVSVEVGEKGGDLRTIQRPTISEKSTLEAVGKEELKRLSYDGYKGSLRGWLLPRCEIGYSAKITDVDYPQRGGTYYVRAVKTEVGRSTGGRRTVTLGQKLSQ